VRSCLTKGSVGTAPIQQWGGIHAGRLHVVHAADDDLVIASGEAVLYRAFQSGQHAVQPRDSGQQFMLMA
jgi:hypothetical protein